MLKSIPEPSSTARVIPQSRSRLDDALDALEKPLASASPEERSEWRAEASAHLHSLVAAHLELGSTPDEALAAALKQFGNTQRIGDDLAKEIRRQRMREQELPFVHFCTPVAIGFAAMAVLTLVGGAFDAHLLTPQSLPILLSTIRVLAVTAFVLTPLVAGWQSRLHGLSPLGLGRIGSRSIEMSATETVYQQINRFLLTVVFVGVGSTSAAMILMQDGFPSAAFLMGILWLPLALIGSGLATARIRQYARGLAPEVTV